MLRFNTALLLLVTIAWLLSSANLFAQEADYIKRYKAIYKEGRDISDTGNWDEAIRVTKEAAAIVANNQDARRLGYCLHQIGYYHLRSGYYQQAAQVLDSAYLLAQTTTDSKLKKITFRYLAEAHCRSSTPPVAKQYLNELFQQANGSADTASLANANVVAGIMYTRFNNIDSAKYHYATALDLFTHLKNEEEVATTNYNIGILHFRASEYPEALTAYLSALTYLEREGNEEKTAKLYNGIANVFEKQQNHRAAIQYLKQGLKKAVAGSRLKAQLSNNLGNIYLNMTKNDSAHHFYEQALSFWKIQSDTTEIVRSYVNLLRLQLQQPKQEGLLEGFLKPARPFLEGVIDTSLLAEYYLLKGEYLISQAQYAQAIEVLDNAAKVFVYYGLPERLFNSIQLKREALFQLNKVPTLERLTTRHDSLKDALFNEQQQATLQELDIQYQTEKRQERIGLLEQVNAEATA